MGWHAARKLRKSLDAFADVIAIELLTAARALALREPLTPSPVTAERQPPGQRRHRRPRPRPLAVAGDRGGRRTGARAANCWTSCAPRGTVVVVKGD